MSVSEWVDAGQPCPLCVLSERHFHSRRPDGRWGVCILVRRDDRDRAEVEE